MWIYSDDFMVSHDPGAAHPERPARLESILASLRDAPPANLEWKTPQAAEWAQLTSIHTSEYVESIRALEGQTISLDMDTNLSEDSATAARLAAGAGIDATNAVLDGACGSAFALVRPPGHHAERAKAMGYCVFNNIALAADHAVRERGIERVLIVDWDVHHGNGTQHIFEERADVMVFNTHQWPLYPGTGAKEEQGIGAGEGFNINVPMPAGSGDERYEEAFREVLLPAAARFEPQLVLISAGYDAHVLDPLGSMQVTNAGYGRLAGLVRAIAEEHADGRVVAFLEGGYDLDGLVGGVRATIEALS
jgi:acetoin utilization deacetylase AcuC-like enzyme